MTKKRFSLAYADYDWWAICDHENPTELGISGEDVVELLNELHEDFHDALDTLSKVQDENQQLQEEIKDYNDVLARLEEKNEELKIENKTLHTTVDSYKIAFDLWRTINKLREEK